MPQYLALSIHEITTRLYGVRTRVETEHITLAQNAAVQTHEIRQNVNRVALLIQNVSSTENLIVSVGHIERLISANVYAGQVLPSGSSLYVTVYEDLSLPSERYFLAHFDADADCQIYIAQVLVSAETIEDR